MNKHVNTNVIVSKTTLRKTTSRLLAGITVAMLATLSLTTSAKDMPGASQTSYGVSPSGAFQFSIPIVVPAGRNGIQPNLSLNYSSSRGNGIAGIGWGVSGLSAITRCGKTIATNGVRGGVLHNNNDRFCLNGSQLILTNGSYGAANSEYRTELDSFAKVQAFGNGSTDINGGTSPTYWKVWAKDGSIYFYGAASNTTNSTAQFKLPGTSSIHAWNLSRMQDRAGNYYEVFYHTDNGRVDRIEYTKHGSSGNTGQVVTFNYEARLDSDSRHRYVLGRKILYDERLKNILVTNDAAQYRKYILMYERAPISKRSRLTAVKECGLTDNDCMPEIDVQWQSDTAGYVTTTATKDIAQHDMIKYELITRRGESKSFMREINYGAWADVNGDGEVDQVIAMEQPNGTSLLKTYIKNGNGWDLHTGGDPWVLPGPLRSYKDSLVDNELPFNSQSVERGILADVNGDGLLDVVYSYIAKRETEPESKTYVNEYLRKTYINTGNGWVEDPDYQAPDYLFDYEVNPPHQTVRARTLDIDGDGLLDWVEAYFNYSSDGNGDEHMNTYLNTGTGWSNTPSSAYEMPDVFVEFIGGHPPVPHGEFVDVNGDGRVDWVQGYQKHVNDPSIRATWLNTETGWTSQPVAAYRLGEPIYRKTGGQSIAYKRGVFVDVNGDGLRDWVRSYKENRNPGPRATFLNMGGKASNTSTNWLYSDSNGYTVPFIHIDGTWAKQGFPVNVQGFFRDLNKDGLVDYVQSFRTSDTGQETFKAAWLNNGTTWVKETGNSPHIPTELYFDYSAREYSKSNFGQFVDINSDGASDWVRHTHNEVRRTRLAAAGQLDQLAKITTTMGVEVKPTFLPLTYNDVIYTKYPTIENTSNQLTAEADSLVIEPSMYVTSKLETSRPDSDFGHNTTRYYYGGLQVHRKGRGSQGFYSFKTTNELGVTTTTERHQAFPLTGRVKYAESSKLETTLSKNKNVYTVETANRSGGTTYFAALDRSTSWSNEYSTNTTFRKAVRDLTFGTYGVGEGDYGNVESDNTTTYTLTAEDYEIEISATYVEPEYELVDTSNWLLNRLKHVQVATAKEHEHNPVGPRDGDVTILKTEFDYDNLGRLIETKREPQGGDSFELITKYRYHPTYGVLEGQDVGPVNSARSDTISYDSDFRLPKTFQNAKGHESEIVTYHAQCDLPTLVHDANDLPTELIYDNFCRQTSVKDAADIVSTVTYETSSEFSSGECASADCQSTAKFKITNGSGPNSAVQDIVTYLNHYGLPMVSETKDINGTTIRQVTRYNRYGLTESETQPYFDGAVDIHAASYEYDELNRLSLVTLPYEKTPNVNATVSYSYGLDTNGWLTRTVTDQEGSTTTSHADALGQIKKVVDALNGSIHYEYNSQGLLQATTDVDGNEIEVKYDRLGRRTKLIDPDLGTSTFDYTMYDELKTQTDAKGQQLIMSYDELSRLTQREVKVPVGQSAVSTYTQWEYDTANATASSLFPGIGALHKVLSNLTDEANSATADHVMELNYDEFGRLAEDLTHYGGNLYQQQYSYTAADGFPKSRQYPTEITIDGQNNRHNVSSPFVLSYEYQNGYLSKVDSVDNIDPLQCTSGHSQWSVDEYDAQGRVVKETLGKLVQTHRGFKPGQGVLESIQSNITDGPNNGIQVQNLSYKFDGVGNVTERSGYLEGVTETFQYDELHRLKNYLHNAVSKVNLTYYANGNIKTKSDVGTYHYSTNGVRPHAVQRIEADASIPDLTHFDVNWEWKADATAKADPGYNPQLYSTGVGNNEYVYDANGNIVQSGNRHITWTSFDKPKTMVRELPSGEYVGSTLEYDGHFNRIKKVESTFNSDMTVAVNKEITFYIGKEYERVTDPDSGAVTHRYTLNLGHHTVQIERAGNDGFDVAKYMLADNLGSTNVILNTMGEVEQSLAFDPWGKRLNVDNSVINKLTNRGYTGHEMDDEMGLINMNARIYDPMLGRFLSADPVLPDAGDMQQFNRYSYVSNNPMKFTDPTGNTQSHCGIALIGECENPSPPNSNGPFTICAGLNIGPLFGGACNGAPQGAQNGLPSIYNGGAIDIDGIIQAADGLAVAAGLDGAARGLYVIGALLDNDGSRDTNSGSLIAGVSPSPPIDSGGRVPPNHGTAGPIGEGRGISGQVGEVTEGIRGVLRPFDNRLLFAPDLPTFLSVNGGKLLILDTIHGGLDTADVVAGEVEEGQYGTASLIVLAAALTRGKSSKVDYDSIINLKNKNFDKLGAGERKKALALIDAFQQRFISGFGTSSVSDIRNVRNLGEGLFEIKATGKGALNAVRVFIDSGGNVIGFANKGNQTKTINRLKSLLNP